MYGKPLAASAVGTTGTLAYTGAGDVFWLLILGVTVTLVGIALLKFIPRKTV